MNRYTLCIILTSFISFNCLGIDIGPMTFGLDSNVGFATKVVTNNSSIRNIYTLKVYEIDQPGRSEVVINPTKRDLLFNPKQFVLSGNSSKLVKFYFNGNSDKERYYRVEFTEMPAPRESRAKASMYLTVKMSSILVVSPKEKNFDYKIDYSNQSITNKGNTFFEFMIKDSCDTPDINSFARYLAPNKSYVDKNISKDKVFVIISDGKFYFPDERCNK